MLQELHQPLQRGQMHCPTMSQIPNLEMHKTYAMPQSSSEDSQTMTVLWFEQ
jgi:hypothetical protein